MSEESNVIISVTEKVEDIETENALVEENPDSKLPSDESPSVENTDVTIEQNHFQGNHQSNEPALSDKSDRSLDLEDVESKVEALDSSLKQQLNTSEATTETKTMETKSDVDQPTFESTAPTETSPSLVPSSDKAVEVTQDIQSINEALKDMKLSEQEVAGSGSAKKGRKPPSTPRAKSTPVILTSPPLTRSRSRDLRKFPSTPSSPGRVTRRKGSESDSDEVKGARGRQREKKN